MSMTDGEYDIDLSNLLENSGEYNNLAIRYGFIPDSMDQTQSLKLYQNEQECLLKASSTEDSSKTIIFEGVPQRLRASNNLANDSYYLSYSPESKEKVVQLKKLNSTIRFSKSRNVAKQESKISRWDKEFENRNKGTKEVPSLQSNIQIPKVDSSVNKAGAKKTSPTPKSKPSTPRIQSKSNSSQVSFKRPPTANNTPEIKTESNIISESDFEDLENDLELIDKASAFPIIEPSNSEELSNRDHEQPEQAKPATDLKEPSRSSKLNANSKSKPKPKAKSVTTESRIVEKSEDIDIDDDFKDLEEQLQEVLEKEESKSTEPTTSVMNSAEFNNNNDDDDDVDDDDDDESDADDYQFSGGPILINVDEGSSNEPVNAYKDNFNNDSTRKPMSLRDLVGGSSRNENDDDLSSSEEE